MNLLKLKNRREVFAWSFYDFANQPFTTIIVTFIYSAFFVKVIAENEQVGTILWANGIAISSIIVAVLSPILGAIADSGGYRKFFLIFLHGLLLFFQFYFIFLNLVMCSLLYLYFCCQCCF